MADTARYLASVDLGTTSVRCFLYDLEGRVISQATEKITQLYPHQGWSEIDPEEVWQKFTLVIKQALQSKLIKSFILYILYISCYVPFLDVDATAKDIKAFGLATQRGSFVTWDKRSGKTFHNLVSHKFLELNSISLYSINIAL